MDSINLLARVLNRLVRPLGLRCVPEPNMAKVPALSPRHLENARLLPNRAAILDLMPKGGRVAEVGVGFGLYTQRMLEVIRPSTFVAIDTFELDKPSWSGRQEHSDVLGELGHEAYYRQLFQQRIEAGSLLICRGLSHVKLGEFPDGYFDMIYIDAAHDYESVRRDLAVARHKISADGFIVLNDYTLMDPLLLQPYGVVQAVHEFCLEEDWEIRYLALHPYMFCDVALKKL